MKNLKFILLICCVCSMWLYSCQEEGEPLKEQPVEFSFTVAHPEDKSGKVAAVEVADAKAIVITIKDGDGVVVVSSEKLDLFNFNGRFITKPITLKPGSYSVSKFLVINDEGYVKYVCPMEGSDKAYLVQDPLEIGFTVDRDKVKEVVPEVISTEGSDPEEFGYATFSLEENELTDFYITVFHLNRRHGKIEPTEATLVISTPQGEIKRIDLKNKTNKITVSDAYNDYRLSVLKPGYESYEEQFWLSEIKRFTEPLKVVLENKFALVAKVIPYNGIEPDMVEAILSPKVSHNQIYIATRNVGAGCGSGTPVAIWSGNIKSLDAAVRYVTSLSQVQSIRNTMFQSSSALGGTIFTGSGWCGYKPSYYADHQGLVWKPSVSGPPNSTFSFAEFKGKVYVGTGYQPYLGEVYRWMGNGVWSKVHELPVPRTIVSGMIEYNEKLFVGSSNYWGSQTGGVPVIVSDDATTFSATTGIESAMDINKLFIVEGKLMALTSTRYVENKSYLYEWNGSSWGNKNELPFNSRIAGAQLTVHDGNIIAYAGYPGEEKGIYISADHGKQWTKMSTWDFPELNYILSYQDALYFGASRNSEGMVGIYRYQF